MFRILVLISLLGMAACFESECSLGVIPVVTTGTANVTVTAHAITGPNGVVIATAPEGKCFVRR